MKYIFQILRFLNHDEPTQMEVMYCLHKLSRRGVSLPTEIFSAGLDYAMGDTYEELSERYKRTRTRIWIYTLTVCTKAYAS